MLGCAAVQPRRRQGGGKIFMAVGLLQMVRIEVRGRVNGEPGGLGMAGEEALGRLLPGEPRLQGPTDRRVGQEGPGTVDADKLEGCVRRIRPADSPGERDGLTAGEVSGVELDLSGGEKRQDTVSVLGVDERNPLQRQRFSLPPVPAGRQPGIAPYPKGRGSAPSPLSQWEYPAGRERHCWGR